MIRRRTSLVPAFLISVLLSAMAAGASDDQTQQQTAANSGYKTLTDPQIEKLFSAIEDIQLPEVGIGYDGGDWLLAFKEDGKWDEENRGVWGSWHVENDKLCIEVGGGDTPRSSPFEGCFSVHINVEKEIIAGIFPTFGDDYYPIKEDAYLDIARLQHSKNTAKTQVEPQSPAPAATASIMTAPEREDPQPAEIRRTDQHAEARNEIERQRLALERERLELQRQKLAFERQALATKQRSIGAIDDAKPVIQTSGSITTTEKTAIITGAARDDGRLTRVEVGGRRVTIDQDTGRFSVEIPVRLGSNRVSVTATDANGNKADRIVLVTRKRAIPDIAFGAYHAVVIGINDYETLPKLKTAVADARAVAQTLKANYGFKVSLLENPTRSDIIDAFDELREKLGEEDNLLIYYAGHGWLDKQSGRGYWLPMNARVDRRSRWVSNADLTDALQALLAKHVMVVADSCYSGTLTRSIKVPERNKAYIERIAEKRARVVLSSGGLEPVADSGGGKHSVFAAQFLKVLQGNESVLDGTQLFEKVRQTVVLNADQTPEYSDIRRAGHEGGDFLFVRKD